MKLTRIFARAFMPVLFLAGSLQAKAQEQAPDSTKLSGQVNINYIHEAIENGNITFNPLQEATAKLSYGDRLGSDLAYEANPQGVFKKAGRLETAALSYKAGRLKNPWTVTAGLIGEQNLEALFGGPGKRPDIKAREIIYGLRVDNNRIFGASVNKAFPLSEQWVLVSDGAVFLAFDPKDTQNRIEDRANSTQPSFTAKAAFKKGKVLSLGAETGLIQHGVADDADEWRTGVFGRFKQPVSDRLTWLGHTEALHFTNHLNQKGKNRFLLAAFSALEYKPWKHVVAWAQAAGYIDSVNPEAVTVETGLRYTPVNNDVLNLSVFGGVDMTHTFKLSRTTLGYQAGAQAALKF